MAQLQHTQARLWELLVESRTGVVPEAALLKWHGMRAGGGGGANSAAGGALAYSPFRHMQLTCPTLMESGMCGHMEAVNAQVKHIFLSSLQVCSKSSDILSCSFSQRYLDCALQM